jgi:hypothetical protein
MVRICRNRSRSLDWERGYLRQLTSMSFDAERLRDGSHALIHPALSASRSKARPRTISVSALEKIFALLRFRSFVADTAVMPSEETGANECHGNIGNASLYAAEEIEFLSAVSRFNTATS